MRRFLRGAALAASAAAFLAGEAEATPVPMTQVHPVPYLVVANRSDLLNPDGTVNLSSPSLAGVGGTDAFSGVGGLIVMGTHTAPGSATYCTASLISPTVVLTAAHCVDNVTIGTIKSITFAVPNGRAAKGENPAPNPGAVQVVSGGAIAVYPTFNHATETGDLALVKLDKPVTGTDIYSIYTGDPIGKAFTKVGDGIAGWGAVGADSQTGYKGGLLDLRKRVGSNIFEAYGIPFAQAYMNQFGVDGLHLAGPDQGVLLYDFDSGSPLNDVFGQVCSLAKMASFCDPQLGVPGEFGIAPGDSGGPSFIDGQIAGITVSGITGAILSFDGKNIYCGSPGNIDPSMNADPGSCTNSSFGEIMEDTNITVYSDFIDAVLSGEVRFASVPEPASLGLVLAGFVGACKLRRRRKGSSS